jgi:cytochrome b561
VIELPLKNTATEFGTVAKLLHWLVAIGLFALIYLGLQQSGLERGPERSEIRFVHSSIALAVFALMTIRLAWRLADGVPAHPGDMPAWQNIAATIVHWGLYASVFVQLVSGAMTVATDGKPLPFFGLFSVPLPVAESDEGHHFWEEIHEAAWVVVAALVALHILAALYHHFIAKTDVLRRMTSGVR